MTKTVNLYSYLTETARFGQFGLTELRCWPQWMLGPPPRRGYDSGSQFCSVVAASLGNATHTVLIVLVATIRIALDNGNGVDKARTYYVVDLVN